LLDYIEDPDGTIVAAFHLSPERGLPDVLVPEPATLTLLLLGGAVVVAKRRRWA
jgi:hypothetical protein